MHVPRLTVAPAGAPALAAAGLLGVALLLAILLGAPTAAATGGEAKAAGGQAKAAGREASCFWFPVFDPESNFAYPDFGAGYWAARFQVPEGSRLLLRGRFPRARYMSLNSYDGFNPIDTLSDTEVEPKRGTTNPFVAGERRDLGRKARRWDVRVVDGPPPDDRRDRGANALYAESSGGVQTAVYRVYVPDNGRGIKAGGGLPLPVLIGADGSRLKGSDACEAINDAERSLADPSIPLALYESLVNTPGADPKTNPAFDPFRWEAFFNFAYALSVFKVGTPSEPERDLLSTEQTGGVYSNGDSRYVSGAAAASHGEILVLSGKMPTFPRTGGSKRMPGGQVRYWSLCQNESPVTTAAVSCIFDEQVPLTAKRRYSIVLATKQARPDTARRSCGVKYLSSGNLLDPLGRRGGGLVLMRNMRPAAGFDQAIQNVDQPGREKEVMGSYLPRMTYMDSDEFVAPGCPNG